MECDRMPRVRVALKRSSNTVKERQQSITSESVIASKRDRLANLRTPWQPGQSGNPGGKPKVLQEILSMGYKNTPQIMARLIDAALHNNDPAVWIAASREVLNRTF